jgi:DNA modification methylase
MKTIKPDELNYCPESISFCDRGDIVFDPYMGSGTTALVAKKNGINYLGIELNPEYIKIAEKRLAQEVLI